MDKIFKALADKNRRKILTLLRDNDLSVNDLLKHFDITQATLSSHLSLLKKSELVTFKIKGKQRIYSINISLFDAFIKELNKFSNNIHKSANDEIIVRGK